MSRVVILRVWVEDETLEALGRREGDKKMTLREFRNWCLSTLEGDIEVIAGERPWEPEVED